MRSAKGTEDAPSVIQLTKEDRDTQKEILGYVKSMKALAHDDRERLGALTTSNEILAAAINELVPEIRETNKNITIILEHQRYPNTGD